MVMTVRHRGQLLAGPRGEAIDDVIAVIWFDQDEETGLWGGIVEPAVSASLLRAQVGVHHTHYWLRLDDGREGAVELRTSEFEADGAHPLVMTGVGPLVRRPRSQPG